MANMHLLESPQGVYRIVCHYAVPAGNNRVGTTWRNALMRFLGGATRPSPSVLVDGDGTGGTISTAEKADVLNGVVGEQSETFTPPGDWATLTNPQRNAQLDEFYAAKKTEFDAWRVDNLDEWGRTR
mgnify:CR=1 FL=1